MPALLVHMSLVQQVLAQPGVASRVGAAARRHRDALLLGSILPDLPYHAHFGQQLARHLLRTSYMASEWGDIFHTRATGRLALALLEHLRRSHLPDDEAQRVLALAAGYICHHAVDRAAHPAIQRLVSLRRRGDEPASVTHSRIERYQNLFYHLDLLGRDFTGTPFPRQLTSAAAGTGMLRPRLDEPLAAALRAACLEVHARTPCPRQVLDWLFGIAAYGRLMSSRLGRMERLDGDPDVLRLSWYQGPELDLLAPLRRGMDLSLAGWRAASELLGAERVTGEVRRAFLQQVPDVDLAMGA